MSGLNYSTLNGCLLNSTSVLQNQQKFAQFYNITYGPQFVLNYRYSPYLRHSVRG